MDINIDLLNQEIYIKKKNMAFPRINNNKQWEKILLENDFFTQNSIKIQEILKTIDFYQQHLHCYYDYSHADILQNGKYIKNQKSYIWFNYIKLKKYSLLSYLEIKNENTNNKNFLRRLVFSYQKLLTSLIKINEKKICYFNLNENNIFINENEYPILTNFEYSLDYTFQNGMKIIENVNKEYLPIEIHILYYISRHNYDVFTLSLLDDIYIFLKNKFPISYQEFIDIFKIFNLKTIKEVFKQLTEFISTWDNYSLSKIYLPLVENFIKRNPYDTKYHFLPKWHSLLKKNLSLSPNNRHNLLNTKIMFDNILSTF